MIKVIIVDDEPIIRKGLISKVNWDELMLTCVCEASNGIDALEKMAEFKPDILITDICMPGMDGLTLVEEALKTMPRLKCIIVSGFSDFEYARQGIRYGVTDYLLKPVKQEELFHVLMKLRNQVHEDDKEQNYFRFLEKQYEHHKSTSRESQLTRVILNKADGMDYEMLEKIWPRTGIESTKYTTIVVQVEPFVLPHMSFQLGDKPLMWFGIRNIIEDRMTSSGQHGVVFKDAFQTNEMIALLRFSKDYERDEAKQWVSEALKGLATYLRLEATAGIGGTAQNIAELYKTYNQAKDAIRNKVITGSGIIYDEIEIERHRLTGKAILLNEEHERLVFNCLENRQEEQLLRWLETQFQKMIEFPTATYSQLEQLCLDMDSIFRKYMTRKASEAEVILGTKKDMLQFLYHVQSWQDALVEFQRKAKIILRFFTDEKKWTGEDIVREVKQYIDQNYFKNLTLQWVAEQYYIHPTYLSKLFKERWGENFNDYITKVRLFKAIELMKDPTIKMQRIAELVGYEEQAYFSNVFRKVYGMSPTKFRDQ